MNHELKSVTGRGTIPRTELTVFNLEDTEQRSRFISGKTSMVKIHGTLNTIPYDAQKRIGVAISKLGTARAVSLGAYTYALSHL